MDSLIRLPRGEASASRLVARGEDKPYNVGNMAIPIALGVTVPLVVALSVLFYLHRRNVRKLREEDAKDPHRSLDFGLDDAPMANKKKARRSLLGGGEKQLHKNNQLSMDMNLSSPYLLPPQDHGSHDSVQSLTRGYPTEFDPYRMVSSEVGSIRSFGGAGQRGSVNSSKTMGTMNPPGRQGSFPKSPISPTYQKEDPFSTPAPPEPAHQRFAQPELHEPVLPAQPLMPQFDSVPFADEPAIQHPPLVADRSSPQHQFVMPEMPNQDTIGMAYDGDDFPRPPSNNANHETGNLSINVDMPAPLTHSMQDPVLVDSDAARSSRMPQVLTTDIRHSKDSCYGDDQPQIQTTEYYDDYAGPRVASLDNDKPQQLSQGLGVPVQNNKRLSVGFRPLPPDEVTQSEDPEYRANRIRSFYKEYFDDGGEPAPPMPALPPQHAGPQQGYYDDYNDNYLESAAYFDPETNAFVMPGAQPVHRRAMTPPPAGRRGPPPGHPAYRGPPRGGSRGPHPRGPSSLGGRSGPRSRSGSAYGGSSRAPSSLGPRPDSSASGRGRQPPRKNLPPPADLHTLPTPSKLKDDSFALLNAADFAPPEAFSSRARGRSQSPMGERRPYQPKVPAVSPLVNTYEELPALPSPHLLTKSSTFTGLDFMPPKKFKDADTMSDAGSIRSNKSGISRVAESAIRSGAGRISRLPGDQVFTTHAMASELKPQWGMRP